MPAEFREIVLDSSELLLAADSYVRIHTTDYPVGRVVAANAEIKDGAPRIAVQINPQNCGDQVVIIQIQDAKLIDLLIRFCHESNVPIPRSGMREARVEKDALSLIVRLGAEELRG